MKGYNIENLFSNYTLNKKITKYFENYLVIYLI